MNPNGNQSRMPRVGGELGRDLVVSARSECKEVILHRTGMFLIRSGVKVHPCGKS